MLVIGTLAPVFGVVALGAFLQRSGFFAGTLYKSLNRLTYWVGLPCLLIVKTSSTALPGPAAIRLWGTLMIGLVGCVVVGYAVAGLFRLTPPTTASLVQAGYRGNLAYVGLPVIHYALSSPGGDPHPLETLGTVVLGLSVPFYNLAAVLILMGGPSASRGRLIPLVKQLASNPLLWACGAGIGWSQLGTPLPAALYRTLSALGQMALPLALLALGASLTATGIRGQIVPSTLAAGIKTAVAPGVGWLAARGLGLDPSETLLAVLYLACPTAVSSYVMAEQLNADEKLAGSAIVISTLWSVLSLTLVLALLGGPLH